ncbi:hypothetical protein F4802DRAFT_445943 [Xylaria palmicola]|nr:hypothetical protein F4802DRAFT_445943 [Xylaria palmicola]
MKFTIPIGVVLALVSSPVVHGWNATIYEFGNCTGSRYQIYPTSLYTKYFEMEGSWGAEIACTFYGGLYSEGPCKEQFPVGKSVFSTVGSCRSYSGAHSSGTHNATQKEGQCMSTTFDIRSVVCYDE